MKRPFWFWACSLFFLCFLNMFALSNASAETAPVSIHATPEDLLFREVPVVFSAALKEQKITSAPAAMNVVSAEEIKERGYRTLKDMVVDIPGWEDVSDSNEITAAVRGMFASTTNKILVMINGHRMNDLNLGRYNLDQYLGTDVIERVEFIKGPGSVLYGNGALIGVINVITKKGSDIDGVYVKQKTTAYRHTWDTESSITLGKKIKDYDLIFNFDFLTGEGDEIPQPSFLNNVPAGRAKPGGLVYYNKYPDNWSFFGSIERENLRLDFRNEHYARAVPLCPNLSFYTWEDEPVKPLYQEDIAYVDLKYTLPFSETAKLVLNPGATFYSLRELSFISSYGANILPPDGTRSGQKSKYNQWQFKAYYENQLKENLNLILGIDSLFADFYNMNGISGTTGAPFTMTQSDLGNWNTFGTFFQLLWSPIKKLELTISGRYDNVQDAADPSFTKRLTKRFALVYKALEWFNTKLLYGESFLSPQWAHLHRVSAGLWNPDSGMQPETFNGYDLIFEVNRGKAFFSLDLFRNRLENLISSSSTYSYTNMGEETYYGLEAEGKYAIMKQLELSGSYSYVRNEGNTTGSFLVDGEIKSVPRNIFRLGLKYMPWDNFNIQAWGRYYTKTRTSDTITGATCIKPWATMDISANYKLNNFDFQIAVTNLFDRYYEVGGSVNRPLARPRRAINFSVGYKF